MSNNISSFKGMTPSLDKSVYISDSARIVGDVRLAKDSSIWPMVAARGDVNYIEIGERSNIQDGTILHVSRKSASNRPDMSLWISPKFNISRAFPRSVVAKTLAWCPGNVIFIGCVLLYAYAERPAKQATCLPS